MIYKFRSGAHVKGVSAQIVGTELERIQEEFGRVDATTILAESERPDAPLHPAFEWDDSKAAHEFRLTQARHVANSIVVVGIFPDEPERAVRAFVNVRDDTNENAYVSVQVALSTPAMRKQMLARALAEAESWRQTYRDYHELAGVFEAIDAVREVAAVA